jgi:hypothetical protein
VAPIRCHEEEMSPGNYRKFSRMGNYATLTVAADRHGATISSEVAEGLD